jgi:cell division protein FtsB
VASMLGIITMKTSFRFPATDIEFALQAELDKLNAENERLMVEIEHLEDEVLFWKEKQ